MRGRGWAGNDHHGEGAGCGLWIREHAVGAGELVVLQCLNGEPGIIGQNSNSGCAKHLWYRICVHLFLEGVVSAGPACCPFSASLSLACRVVPPGLSRAAGVDR